MHLRITILCLFAFISINSHSQESRVGYIIEVRDNKVYLDYKAGEAEAGNIFEVLKGGNYFTHPVTGDSIKEEDYVISQVVIDEVKTNYSIATAFPSQSVSLLEKGMKVIRIGSFPEKKKELKKTVSVHPSLGINTYGFLEKYATDLLTDFLLKSNSIRVFDPKSKPIQPEEIIVDTGIVLTESATQHYISASRAEYSITCIIYEPVVIDLSTQKSLNLFKSNASGIESPYIKRKTTRALANYSPAKAEIKPLKAVIKVGLQVSNINTGEYMFFCTDMQEYEASRDINIEQGFLYGINTSGSLASFKNTVTGKATELALQNLTTYINDYFDGKITGNSFTGNVIDNFHSDYKIMISDLTEKGSLIKMKIFSKPNTLYQATLNNGKNMNIRPNDDLDIFLTSDNSDVHTSRQAADEKIGYLKVTESDDEISAGDLVFNYDFNASDFNKEETYLKIKNLWSTLFFISRVPTINIKQTDEPEVIQNEIMYCGIGYMLNYKVGFYSYLGYGNTILKSGTTSMFNTYYGSLGITKSMGRNTNIGAGLTAHYSNVKVLDSRLIQSIDVLGSTRLKNNLTIIYGCSVPTGNQTNLLLSLGAGYSF